MTVKQHPASISARRAAGEARRKDVPLEDHAELVLGDDRPDPLATLAAQDEGRVQELVPIRYGRMSRTPFTFLRGAAAVMAADIAAGPSTDLRAQLCGDAHLSNFGYFNSADQRLIFDVNDFDETLPGPFEWDLKRLVASITVAGRGNDLDDDKIDRATRAAVKSYRELMNNLAGMSPLDIHYYRIEAEALYEQIESKKAKKEAKKQAKKAKRKNSLRAQRKLTDIVDGRRVIVPDPPLVDRVDRSQHPDARSELEEFFGRYRATLSLHRRHLLDRFSVVDMAFKVVGVGSVGTRCLIVLLESGGGDPLLVPFKEATTSVLEPYVGASKFDLSGRRVVEGQRLIQASGDIFLGWARWEQAQGGPLDFYFRQLWDGKGSVEVEAMGGKQLRRYAGLCGATLALGHARSGDPAMIAGYVGEDATLDHALVAWAEAYADRTEADHALMQAAIDDGRIDVVEDI